jgi:response regulator RpfG family c-di-GMP phosphodiesterase
MDVWHLLAQTIRYGPPQGAGRRLLTIHDLNFLYAKGVFSRLRHRWRLRSLLRHCDELVTISEHVAGDVRRELGWRGPLTVVHNGVRDLSAAPREPLPALQGRRFLFHISRMTPSKNVEALLAMMKGWPEMHLVLAGPAAARNAELQAQAAALGLANVSMLTAVNDAPTATEALGLGAMDYLMKPVELTDLAAALERALHKRALSIEQRKVERIIREEVATQTDELRKERENLDAAVVGIVTALVRAQESKDVFLRGHSERVADLAASIASVIGLSDDEVEGLRIAGRVMDVGRIGIRDAVLNKPGSLTDDEFEHVKEHVNMGLEILSAIRPLAHLLPAIAHHHEHWDGSGYPHGLVGENISVGGRILAAADAFNALTAQRAYRDSMSQEAAIEFLGQRSGSLLAPEVYEALRRVVTSRKSLTFLDPASD